LRRNTSGWKNKGLKKRATSSGWSDVDTLLKINWSKEHLQLNKDFG